MKYHRIEGPIAYSTYQFAYTEWAELDPGENPGPAYAAGYLPYSGKPDDPRHCFYMARSLRVAISRYGLKKGRRYDHRMWSSHGLQRSLMEKEVFMERHGHEAQELAGKWMEPRFGNKALSMERLAYILGKPYLNSILAWHREDRLCAYALLASGTWGAHYWYVFYENGTSNPAAPGHGYLVDFLDWTREHGLPYAYIGTAYGRKSRYKSRGIHGIEFWDGNGWSTDRKDLEQRQHGDDQALPSSTQSPCRTSWSEK